MDIFVFLFPHLTLYRYIMYTWYAIYTVYIVSYTICIIHTHTHMQGCIKKGCSDTAASPFWIGPHHWSLWGFLSPQRRWKYASPVPHPLLCLLLYIYPLSWGWRKQHSCFFPPQPGWTWAGLSCECRKQQWWWVGEIPFSACAPGP